MVVGTSVLIHVLFGERGCQASLRWLARQPTLRVSAPSWVEARIVLAGSTIQPPGPRIGELRTVLNLEVVAFDAEQAHSASSAYARFGKGRGHPAQLNSAGVLVYGMAASVREPLAYVGADFGRTDLENDRLAVGSARDLIAPGRCAIIWRVDVRHGTGD